MKRERLIGSKIGYVRMVYLVVSRVVRMRYEGGVFKPLDEVDVEEGEEIEVVIRRKTFTESDYRELVRFLEKISKGRIDLLDAVEKLYYKETLR